jgi:broad specificity phosphatase PhoE
MPRRIYLIRHGESDWNVARRWQGFAPTGLNDTGRQQAQALADYLRTEPIDAIYTSDLPRALETAHILGAALGAAPQVDTRWREINVGVFQGMTAAEVEQHYPAELAAWRADTPDYRVPNGESRRELQDRAAAAWHDVAAGEGRAAAVVSHGGTIRLLLRRLFGPAAFDSQPLHNTSITTLTRAADGVWTLESAGATPHLRA